MPSKSRSQQRLFCMAYAVRKGKLSRKDVTQSVLDIADGDMTDQQIKDFMVREGMISLKDFLMINEDYVNPIPHLQSEEQYNNYKYYIKGTQVELSGNVPITPTINQSVTVRGKAKDIPCVIEQIDGDEISLKPVGAFAYLLAESYVYDTKYANGFEFNPKDKPFVFIIVKPGFLNKTAEIIEKFEKKGFEMIKTKPKLLTLDEAKKLYLIHKNEDFYKDLCHYMSSGESYGIIFEYNKGSQKKAIEVCSELKDDIRELWSKSEMKNVMHSSDSEDNMYNEMRFYF